MFKEEYKRCYDSIHPSQELMDKTRKLAMEKAENPSDETEAYAVVEPEMPSCHIRRWYKIAGTVAAAAVLVVSGMYFSRTLHPVEQQPTKVSLVQATMEVTQEPITTEGSDLSGEQEQKNEIPKDQNQIHTNASQNQLQAAAEEVREMVYLDYASETTAVLHSNFGILVYNIGARQVKAYLSAERCYVEKSDWQNETVRVNQDGTKLLCYRTAEDKVTQYDLTKQVLTEMTMEEANMADYQTVQAVHESAADIYNENCKTGQITKLSDGRFCQLLYEVPTSGLQASLAISLYDSEMTQEQLYPVFGEIGWSVIQAENVWTDESYIKTPPYDTLHRANRESQKEETAEPEATRQPEDGVENEADVVEENVVTEEPKETPLPETAEPVVTPAETEME